MYSIKDIVDKAWENKSFKEIAEAPVSALQGVSEEDEKLLKKAFKVKRVKDLANLKYVKWAEAITTLAKYEK